MELVLMASLAFMVIAVIIAGVLIVAGAAFLYGQLQDFTGLHSPGIWQPDWVEIGALLICVLVVAVLLAAMGTSGGGR